MSDARKIPRPAIIEGGTARIPLGIKARYGYALIDADMAWLADKHKWTLDSTKRYAVTGTYEYEGKRQTLTYLHRVVMNHPAAGMIDHISRDRLDNRRINLRLVDNRINQLNTATRGGTSKYRGVGWDKRRSKWYAKLKSYSKTVNIGDFDSEKDAAKAYNIAALQHFGKDAQLNDI